MGKIFLDYGHGGSDPGAVSGSYKEKDFNFKIGQRVKYHLDRHGQTVIESRISDVNPSLSERSNKANDNNVDLSVSLHCNSFNDPSAQGLETYTYGSGTREIHLANCVHNSIINANLYTKNRGIKQADLHMVREIKTAAILVEMGFITNSQDISLLINKYEEYAVAIAIGILSFYGISYKSETISEPGEKKYYRVQVGAFSDMKNAEEVANDLRSKGYTPIIKYY